MVIKVTEQFHCNFKRVFQGSWSGFWLYLLSQSEALKENQTGMCVNAEQLIPLKN